MIFNIIIYYVYKKREEFFIKIAWRRPKRAKKWLKIPILLVAYNLVPSEFRSGIWCWVPFDSQLQTISVFNLSQICSANWKRQRKTKKLISCYKTFFIQVNLIEITFVYLQKIPMKLVCTSIQYEINGRLTHELFFIQILLERKRNFSCQIENNYNNYCQMLI